MSMKSRPSILPLAIGAIVLALAAPASAQNIAEVAVSPRAPTHIVISVAGKAPATVRGEVHAAARTVCRNAVRNSELDFQDVRWCNQKSEERAMSRYAVMLASAHQTAGARGTILLSVR